LGELRSQVHQLHGVPLVVTFDAPYLLRASADKARAWADLCLALELVAPAA
jgi:DNA polymerase